MNWKRWLGGEVIAAFFLAWEAIILWNVIVPIMGIIEQIIRRPGQWSQLLGVIALGGSYYFLLSVTLVIARKYNPKAHPITTAYLGGWWLIILLAALSVQSAAFNDVLGLPMATSGTNLLVITTIVGLAKYWIDGYRNPPVVPETEKAAPTSSETGDFSPQNSAQSTVETQETSVPESATDTQATDDKADESDVRPA